MDGVGDVGGDLVGVCGPRDGLRDAILVWHVDRLHRRPIELEELADTCARAGVSDLHTVHGSFDLRSGDGMLVARMLAAVASNESEAKARRIKRKWQERAEAGKPHCGGARPYGFKADRVTHDPAEAEVIRTLTVRALAGESLSSLARWLNETGVPTASGRGRWQGSVVHNILLRPRNYGVRIYQGQPLVTDAWEPIISAEEGQRLHDTLTAPERKKQRAARRYLLSGICRCSLCDARMHSSPTMHGGRRYVCKKIPETGGCGRMSIAAAPLDEMIVEAVLIRLDSPTLHDAMAGRVQDDGRARVLSDQISDDTEQLNDLAKLWGNREVTAPEWSIARSVIDNRLTQARRELSLLSGTRQLDAYIGKGSELRRQWATLNLDRQRAIVKALVDHVEILPADRAARTVSVDRVRPIWRV